MHAPTSLQNACSSDEVRQQPGKARPLPPSGSPALRVEYPQRVQQVNEW